MKKSFVFVIACVIAISSYAQDAESRLKEKGIVLTPPPRPVANYIDAGRVGNLLYLSGRGPQKPDGIFITGKLGKDFTIEQGYEAARLVAMNHLAV